MKKKPQRRDNAGAVCNSGMGMFFFIYYLLLYSIISCLVFVAIDVKGGLKKMPQRRDNAGAVCNSGMSMLFLCISFFYIISLRGVLIFFDA